ncbi:MAG: aminoglycoside phosphotransferase family protein [Fimbriimonadaceae bacterium]|nr:aminoglycoside phosphotransferase family protein [Fimbriimonadaceae bacterium]
MKTDKDVVNELGKAVVNVRPNHINGGYEDYTLDDIRWIVTQFQVSDQVEVLPFPGKGNINLHTYEIKVEGLSYLLQKVNSSVFAFPYRVMNGMCQSIQAQRESLKVSSVENWEPIELVPTKEGKDFLDLTDEHGWSVWRLMVKIPDSCSFKSLSELPDRDKQLELAEEIGKGLAIYSDLTSSIDASTFEGSLPGYRDTALYFAQFHSVLAGNRSMGDALALMPEDPVLKTSAGPHFVVSCPDEVYESRLNDPEVKRCIELIKSRERFAMQLWEAMRVGLIRNTLIHGDTKIENFLFDTKSLTVKSLVDLDTIMSFTWLADYGDMLRSMVNVAGEKESNPENIQVDKEVFKSVTKGFLKTSNQVTLAEIELMFASIQIITLELGVRFLTDYIKGDTYFMLGEGDPEDLNKIRGIAQITLFERLVEFENEAIEFIRSLV